MNVFSEWVNVWLHYDNCFVNFNSWTFNLMNRLKLFITIKHADECICTIGTKVSPVLNFRLSNIRATDPNKVNFYMLSGRSMTRYSSQLMQQSIPGSMFTCKRCPCQIWCSYDYVGQIQMAEWFNDFNVRHQPRNNNNNKGLKLMLYNWILRM